MIRPEFRTNTIVFTVMLVVAVAPLADGATRYVADTGTDGASCGINLATACRSISQAVELANPGDTILVGPGRYGDLNRNGILGEPGEELGYLTPPASCSCVLRIEKQVIIISSAGAAVTIIDGRSVDVIQNVFLTTVGGEFGRPGKGFTVTETAYVIDGYFAGNGIVLDSANVMVRGNQVMFTANRGDRPINFASGILTVNHAAIRIEGNQVMNWARGIEARGAATVSKNHVIHNGTGITAFGGNIVGNVATENGYGVLLRSSATATGNAAYLNEVGFYIDDGFTGVVTKNNMFGNNPCGLLNTGVPGLSATNNYWGATTGPGAPGAPADRVCGDGATTAPFATKPFVVKVLKP